MLVLDRVSKTYVAGADRVEALRDVSLSLAKSDFLTIIGSNGAGKSTLLNLVAGTVLPTAGRVRMDDTDVTGIAAHRRARWIGRIVQDPLAGTAPQMTVVENLALALKRGRRGLRPALPRARKRELRDRLAALGLGLEARMDCAVSLLSGGERQALTVLMATLVPPRVLLLDEHTAALDPSNATMIVELTASFVKRYGLATLMITHNMEQAIAVGNRLIMMHKWEVIHEVADEAKRQATVESLVQLFAGRHVVDDELLLDCVPQAVSA